MLESGDATRLIVVHIMLRLSVTCSHAGMFFNSEVCKGRAVGLMPTIAGLPAGETGTSACRLTLTTGPRLALPVAAPFPSMEGRGADIRSQRDVRSWL